MASDPSSVSTAPDLPFVYVGGDPSLDLVNTVDWTARGLELDRLDGYDRLTRWAVGAGVLSDDAGQRLRREGVARPQEATAAYRSARWLRWVLRRLFTALAAGAPPGAALDDLNDVLAECARRLELAPADDAARARGEALSWRWRGAADRLDAPLWPVARSAALLLASPEGGRVRVCAGPDCGWVYVDRSRNGMRRWCQMEVCGTREKSRRRRGARE